MSHKSLRQFASLFLALVIIFGGFTPVRADTNIQLIPMDDGCVFDQTPFDGIGDAVEYSLSVCSGLNPGIAEFRGAMEFDVSSIASSNTIESASLYVTPIGLSWLPGTSNMPLQLFGYTGNGAIGNDDFNAGSVIAIFNGLTIPINVPVILDVTEFLQNQAPTDYVGFSLRTEVHGGVDFGSLELGSAPILLITLKPTTEVNIDIKPGSSTNNVNHKSEGVIPVAILSTDDFDAYTVDRDTVLFGVTGNEASPVHSALSDVDGDGDMDVIFHFNIIDTGLVMGDTVANLTGQTTDGRLIQGSDSVNIVNIPSNIKPSIIDLGTLGGTYSSPQAINERGQIIGMSQAATGEEHAFFWQNGVMTEIGTLGGAYIEPYWINKYGQVLGSGITDLGEEHVFFWDHGVLIDLGTLGGTISYPQALNNLGQAVGFSETASGDYHAFRWWNGVMIDLGTLGGADSYPAAINESGQVVGWSQTTSGELHAFLWQGEVMIDLGTLGGSYIYSYEITENGQVLGHGQTATGYDHAFLWQNSVLIDLGTLGGNDSYPYAINESGQVVGVSKTISGEDHAFFWQDGVMTDLGTLGGNYIYPQVINENGQVLGHGQTTTGYDHAFLWQNGVLIDLGTLGGNDSYPTAINERGQVIGSSETASGDWHVFYWQGGAMTDLTNFGLLGVQAINDRGQIVGVTLTSSGEYHAALLKK